MIPTVSNIAWPSDLRHEAYAELRAAGVSGLEIAPGLFLPQAQDMFDPEGPVVDSALSEVEDAGLKVVSMQALTFGVEDIALFGSTVERAGFETALCRAVALAGRLAVPAMVFGSPRHRIVPEGMGLDQAMKIAAQSFTRLADIAAEAGTKFALEANPEAYGTNFMTDIEQALAVVEEVNHPSVGLNLDLGAQIMNGAANDLEMLLDRALPHVVHVHISEPFLAPVAADADLLNRLVAALAKREYKGAISIEMRPTDDDPIVGLRTALEYLTDALRRAGNP